MFDCLYIFALQKSTELSVVSFEGIDVEYKVVDAVEIDKRTHCMDHIFHTGILRMDVKLSFLLLPEETLG